MLGWRSYDVNLGRDGNGPYRLLRGFNDRAVRRFLWALEHPREAQQERLQVILRQAAGTRFGETHGLDEVRSLEDLRAALPVVTAAQHRPWLERVAAGEPEVLTREPVQMLLETSGTTGRPKHLPVTETWSRGVSQAQLLWVLAMVRDHEAAARGKALTVVSAARHAISEGGLPIGANTGRMHARQPWWLRLRYPVPTKVFGLQPVAARHYAILRFALQVPITSWTTANPSTILLLARRLQEWREPLSQDLAEGTLRHGPAADLDPAVRRPLERKLRRRPVPQDWRPAHLWPLSLVNCWKGGPAAWFVDRLPQALGAPVPVREVGLTASEGYFALPLGDDWDGGVLWTLGHVLEFIGDDGQPRWAWELEPGEELRLVITTEAGLYRYDLQDRVRVVGRAGQTPVVRFMGKAGRYLNLVNERVTESQLIQAMRQLPTAGVGFCARPIHGDTPRYEVWIEGPTASAGALDEALMEQNLEYASKRRSGRLAPPVVRQAPPGTFARYRQARVLAGAPEGQVKEPVMALDEAEWTRIEEAML